MGNTLKIKRESGVFAQILIFLIFKIFLKRFLITLSYLESKTIQKNTIHFVYIYFFNRHRLLFNILL